MEPITVPINQSKEEEAMKSISAEKSVTEGKKEAPLGTTTVTKPSFAIFVTRDKRKQCFDSSSDDDSEGDEEEEENTGKRLLTEEAKLTSHQEWYDAQLEENKQNLFQEMREKENKLMMLKWGQKGKEEYASSNSVDRLKEELALLQIMYQQLVI
ncbi:unnamed protein product [Nezara viridula]|uniref:Uncharacterized protein n=1 Tax=Nezara viridula TaxID=85310 RepID=A0A9P0HPR7_NEZVI|nr:unnamed protein product [Nezara viridula]